jgi:hypothetical protein
MKQLLNCFQINYRETNNYCKLFSNFHRQGQSITMMIIGLFFLEEIMTNITYEVYPKMVSFTIATIVNCLAHYFHFINFFFVNPNIIIWLGLFLSGIHLWLEVTSSSSFIVRQTFKILFSFGS